MTTHAIALAILAVVLAWPVPMALARAEWPNRAPGAALVLWQAVAIAGGLAMVGAPLCLGLAPFGDSLPAALVAGTEAGLSARPVSLPIASFLGLIVAAVIAGYLLAHLAATVVRVTGQQRRHLELLELLSSPHPTRSRTRVIDDERAVAYCLPSGVGSLTVLSRGLLDELPADELAAVIAHEEAHLMQRHDIVAIAFRAWHRALPWFPVAALAEERVAALTEMLADDHARRVADDGAVARAIVTVAERAHIAVPGDPFGDDGESAATVLQARVSRLVAPRPLGRLARVAVMTAALALVAVPTVQLTLPPLLPA